jgi:hypothetical protein
MIVTVFHGAARSGIRGYATPGEGPVRLVLALVLMAKKSRKKKARKKSAANHGKRPNS